VTELIFGDVVTGAGRGNARCLDKYSA